MDTNTNDGTLTLDAIDESLGIQTFDWQPINPKSEAHDKNVSKTETLEGTAPSAVLDMLYSCVVCNSTFPEVPDVLDHIMNAHRGGVLCLKCKNVMPNNAELKDHEKKCNNDRPFFYEYVKCSICSKYFQYCEKNISSVCEDCASQCDQNIDVLSDSLPVNNLNLEQDSNIDCVNSDNITNEYIDINTYLNFREDSNLLNNESQNSENTFNSLDVNSVDDFEALDALAPDTSDIYNVPSKSLCQDHLAEINISDISVVKEVDNFNINPSIQRESVPVSNFATISNLQTSKDIPESAFICEKNKCDQNSSIKNVPEISIISELNVNSDQASPQPLPIATVKKVHGQCNNKDCRCLAFADERLELSVCKKLCNIRTKLLEISHDGVYRKVDYCVFCLVCQKDLLLEIYFISHILKYHKCKCYKCALCGRKIGKASIPNFLNHFYQHLDIKMKNEPMDCKICKASFYSAYNLQQHCEIYHCPSKFQNTSSQNPLSASDLQKLEAMKKFCVKQFHMETFTIHCNSCSQDFSKDVYFDNHILNCTKDEAYTCSLCFEHIGISRDDFLMQMWVHCLMIDTQNYVQCMKCRRTFPNLDNLLMHKTSKHSEEIPGRQSSNVNASLAHTKNFAKTLHSRYLDIKAQRETLNIIGQNYAYGTSCKTIKSKNPDIDTYGNSMKLVSTTSVRTNLNDDNECFTLGDESMGSSHYSVVDKAGSSKQPLIKPQKLGKDELQEAVIPPYVIEQTEFIFNWYTKENISQKDKDCVIFCLACKEDILLVEYVRSHFIECFERNGGKCPFCCCESEDEHCNVLDHLMHVWNCHFATKWQYFKHHLCTKCNTVLINPYNMLMHNAFKHTVTKSSKTNSTVEKSGLFQLGAIQSKSCSDDNGAVSAAKLQRLG